MNVNIIGAEKLQGMLRELHSRTDSAVQEACKAEAQAMRDNLIAKHFRRQSLWYHLSKARDRRLI